MMKIFISWSGEQSHKVACALRDWLPSVLQHVDPWVSSEDIDKGARWIPELGKQLESAQFGIICLVPGNLHEPWINFEAGAMSRSIDAARVSPFLVGIDRSAVQGPLAQFQSTIFEKEDVRKLIHSINHASENPIVADRLNRAFDLCWLGLAQELTSLAREATEVREESEEHADHDDLPQKQIKILVFLAQNPTRDPSVEVIAQGIGENVTRTQYYLDQLMDQGLVDHALSMIEPPTYYLTAAGRAYVVERNFV